MAVCLQVGSVASKCAIYVGVTFISKYEHDL